MALWAKIQSLNTDCQRQILSLYDEDHKDYRFPIEVRNLFAEAIEDAVCGGSVDTDVGLDPFNAQHRDSIVNFFTKLTGLLEERLNNASSGDQFFTRHKLSESLTHYTEKQQKYQTKTSSFVFEIIQKDKKQTDPLGMFEHMRSRIKAEMTFVAQQEAAANSVLTQEKDAVMDVIQYVKAQIAASYKILNDIRTNEEHFSLNCNKKQELEGFLNNPKMIQNAILQHPDFDVKIKENLAALEGHLQQNVVNLQTLMQRFEETVGRNLNMIAELQGKIINEKLAVWKHEQQQMANGIEKIHSVTLDKLQLWCEELAELIWKNYEQLKGVERILQNGVMQTGNAADLTFVQSRADEVIKLLQELLNHSLIVEKQPPQIIKMKTKFPKEVVVSLLVGKRLNIHMGHPTLATCIINEDQAKSLAVADKLETIGDITNGELPMECKDDSKRLTVTFRSMQLKTIKRTDKRGSVTAERVMEEKSCLHFSCLATVGALKFKVSTISLPVVVISHGSQEALAVASISWDNAFGEIGRVPFKVRTTAPWADVAQILNAKFVEVTGRGLTEDNLVCLGQKAFRHRKPQPEMITWSELCKDNLPGRNFTFWAWFHAALKVIEKKDTHLKDLWREGLIMGFIERETAENLIYRCEPGTFLLRFADSLAGAITIALLVKPGTVMSLNPYQLLDLQSRKLAMSIKDVEKLKYLYQETRSLPKDEAFGKFYEKENAQSSNNIGANGKPYVTLLPTIPDGDCPNGSETPVPSYDGSGSRWSQGSLPGLSPVHIDASHSPFCMYPPSPYDMQNTMTMDASYYEPSENSNTTFLLLPNGSGIKPNGDLETPTINTTSDQVFQFSTEETFEDLIKVIQRDTGAQVDEAMDIQN